MTTSFVPGRLGANLFGGETEEESRAVDWLSNDIRVMLCTSGFVPDKAALKWKSQVTHEVEGFGYDPGGKLLAAKTVSYDAETDAVRLDAGNAVWNPSTITARVAVVYDDTPEGDANKPVLHVSVFDEDIISSNGEFKVEWNEGGIIALQAL